MFCQKCGTENSDSAKYCKGCGRPIQQIPPVPTTPTVTPMPPVKKKSGGKKMVIALVVILAIGAAFFLVRNQIGMSGISFGTASGKKAEPEYMQTADEWIDCLVQGDAKGLVKLLPVEHVGKIVNDILGGDLEGIIEDGLDSLILEYQDDWESYKKDYLEGFEDLDISHKAIKSTDVTGSSLEDIQSNYQILGIKVTDAKVVTVEVTVDDHIEDIEIPVVQIDKTWYVDVSSFDFVKKLLN